MLYVHTDDTGTAPSEDFSVIRLKQRFWAQSYVAGIYTGRRTPGLGTENTIGVDFRLATARFRGSQNLEFDTYAVRTDDVGGLGGNWSYGTRIGFPNDPWDANLSYEVVEENVNPVVGFVPRTGFKNLNPRVSYRPRPRNHSWIRRLDFGAGAELLVDMRNRWLTREIDWQVLRVETHSQEGFGFTVLPEYQRLEDDFEISDGIVLPMGGTYDFVRYRVSGNTANRRIVSVSADYEWGGFYSGTRRQFNANINLRPRPGVRVQIEGDWNEVDLAEGSFRTRLYRLLADTQFNPWMFIVNNVQYDTVSGVLGWQARFRWTWRPGSDLFFTYTNNWIEDTFDRRFQTLDRRGALKLVYGRRF